MACFSQSGSSKQPTVHKNLSEGPKPVLRPLDIRGVDPDEASRVTQENWIWGEPETTRSTYDDDGRIKLQRTYGSADPNDSRRTETSFNYDAADVLVSYRVTGYESDGTTKTYTSFYSNSYEKRDSYLLTGESAHTNQEVGPTLTGNLTRHYNANGELESVDDFRDPEKNRFFVNNANGQAITVVQGDLDTIFEIHDAFVAALGGVVQSTSKAQHFYFMDGQNVGTVGRLQNGSSPQTRASFDVNYTPLEQLAASVPAQVVVQEGDTLRTIAGRVFGDEALWYVIADANGETNPDGLLPIGRVLTIPNQVVSLANNANTFKPFSVDKIIGESTATQAAPPPPAENGCGVVGMIILAVIAIVVTCYLGPAIGAQIAEVEAGAAVPAGALAVGYGTAAAAGSALTQGISIAVGAQDEFNWKSLAASALTAGITAGATEALGEVLEGLNHVAQGAINGAVGSVVNQGVNVALGLQDKFSWKELAISAVSSGSVAIATTGMKAGVLKNAVGAVTSGVVRLALGGRMETSAIIADVFANIIGNSIVDGLNSASMSAVEKGIDAAWGSLQADAAGKLAAEISAVGGAADVPALGQIRALDRNPSIEARLPENQPAPDQRPRPVQVRGPDGTTTESGSDLPTVVVTYVKPNQMFGPYRDGYITAADFFRQARGSGEPSRGRHMTDDQYKMYVMRNNPAAAPAILVNEARLGVGEGLTRRIADTADAIRGAPSAIWNFLSEAPGEAMQFVWDESVAASQHGWGATRTAATLGGMKDAFEGTAQILGERSFGENWGSITDYYGEVLFGPDSNNIVQSTRHFSNFVGYYGPDALLLPVGELQAVNGVVRYGRVAAASDASVMSPKIGSVPRFTDDVFDELAVANKLDRLEIPSWGKEALLATPGRTTTIIGRWNPDMEVVLRQLNPPTSFDFGPKPGGFNVLNIPGDVAASRTPRQFFYEFNQPWLNEAIVRDDIFPVATKPDFLNGSLYQINSAGRSQITMFGREYLEMRRAGYVYDPVTRQMVKN